MELRLHSQLVAVFIPLLACAAFADPRPLQTNVIKQFPLDERTVYEIGIGREVPTTLMFPSAISAIEGANVSSSPDAPAPVLLAYTPGQYFFSVRALTPGAKGAVNVVWHNRTFVIRFKEDEQPYGSVTFYVRRFLGPQSRTAKTGHLRGAARAAGPREGLSPDRNAIPGSRAANRERGAG